MASFADQGQSQRSVTANPSAKWIIGGDEREQNSIATKEAVSTFKDSLMSVRKSSL